MARESRVRARASAPILAGGSRPERISGSRRITYPSILLAVVVGILHASLSPSIEVAGVKPNLVEVAVVLVTACFGFLPGLTWAFVAGMTANLLVPEPLGLIPLTMLAAAAAVAGGQRILGRLPWIYPVIAVFGASVGVDVATLLILRLVGETLPAGLPMQLIGPAALLNAAIGAALLYPTRILTERYAPQEKAAW
jgi:rod shape-determining protein MreD